MKQEMGFIVSDTAMKSGDMVSDVTFTNRERELKSIIKELINYIETKTSSFEDKESIVLIDRAYLIIGE